MSKFMSWLRRLWVIDAADVRAGNGWGGDDDFAFAVAPPIDNVSDQTFSGATATPLSGAQSGSSA